MIYDYCRTTQQVLGCDIPSYCYTYFVAGVSNNQSRRVEIKQKSSHAVLRQIYEQTTPNLWQEMSDEESHPASGSPDGASKSPPPSPSLDATATAMNSPQGHPASSQTGLGLASNPELAPNEEGSTQPGNSGHSQSQGLPQDAASPTTTPGDTLLSEPPPPRSFPLHQYNYSGWLGGGAYGTISRFSLKRVYGPTPARPQAVAVKTMKDRR